MDALKLLLGDNAASQPVSNGTALSATEETRTVRTGNPLDGRPQNPADRAGLRRLNEALESGQPLRQDVPRGFYVNLSV